MSPSVMDSKSQTYAIASLPAVCQLLLCIACDVQDGESALLEMLMKCCPGISCNCVNARKCKMQNAKCKGEIALFPEFC